MKSKYENGDESTKIYCDLDGIVSSRTIKLRIQMINNTALSLCHALPVVHEEFKLNPIPQKLNDI